ncbi:MAG: Cytochrome c oxidase subunit 6 [Thelocarpon impressellum]|nr:MAG: Cytochrome c oxidase subunit 6 [Thelocarpon impressellum]
MSPASLLRLTAVRSTSSTPFFRSSYSVRRLPLPLVSSATGSVAVLGGGCSSFSTTTRRQSDHEESFEEFTARYEKEFEGVQDVFELQRNLNNAFAYDLVPSPSVIIAALKAARRVNDFPTAVRIFEGIKAKVENKGQYDEYLRDLKDVRDEMGVLLKEEMYPDQP